MWIATILSLIAYPFFAYFIDYWLTNSIGVDKGFSKTLIIMILATVVDTGFYYVVHDVVYYFEPASVVKQEKKVSTGKLLSDAVNCDKNGNSTDCSNAAKSLNSLLN